MSTTTTTTDDASKRTMTWDIGAPGRFLLFCGEIPLTSKAPTALDLGPWGKLPLLRDGPVAWAALATATTGRIAGRLRHHHFPTDGHEITPALLSDGSTRLEWQTDGSIGALLHNRAFHNDWRGAGQVFFGEHAAGLTGATVRDNTVVQTWRYDDHRADLRWRLLPGGWHLRVDLSTTLLHLSLPAPRPTLHQQATASSTLTPGWQAEPAWRRLARTASGTQGWWLQGGLSTAARLPLVSNLARVCLAPNSELIWQAWSGENLAPLLALPHTQPGAAAVPTGRWIAPPGVTIGAWQRHDDTWHAPLHELVGDHHRVSWQAAGGSEVRLRISPNSSTACILTPNDNAFGLGGQ